MPFRKSQFKKIEQEINDVSRSNRIDNIKDLSQEIRIKALETLLNLVKELSDILKEIKPSSKSLKIAREKIDKCIEQDKRNN